MSRLRPEEAWARRCIAFALGDVEVRHRDDGREPRVHDLDIIYKDGPGAAVEVTAAADAESIELWKLINGGDRWIEPSLAGGWSVALRPSARAGQLSNSLPGLLKKLEDLGVRELIADPRRSGPLIREALSLGITHLFQSSTEYGGSIYPTIDLPEDRSGGVVDSTEDALPTWLSDWTRDPRQADNLEKLKKSGQAERHLFVILPGFADAPFAVVDLLMRERAPLPGLAPDLPPSVTHVWTASTWSTGSGMRWSTDQGWLRFNKLTGERVS